MLLLKAVEVRPLVDFEKYVFVFIFSVSKVL